MRWVRDAIALSVLSAAVSLAQTSRLAEPSAPRALTYNVSKSSTGNILVSDGSNCNTAIVTTDAGNNVTGFSTTAVPCFVPAGEYSFAPLAAAQIPPVVSVIPHVPDGGGWKTTIVLTNLTPTAATASLAFYQETAAGDGSTAQWIPPLTENVNTQSLTLPPGGTLFLHTPGTAANLTQGWAQMTASDGVQASATFTYTPTGNLGTAPAALAANDVAVPFDNSSGNGTAVAIANPTSVSETVTISFQTDAGVVTQTTLQLPANAHKSFVLASQFPATAAFRGLAEFATSNPGGLALIGLQFNGSGSLTTASATPLNNRKIIAANDPSACVLNPGLFGCPPAPFGVLTLTASFPAGGGNYPVTINVTPQVDGAYTAALIGNVGGVAVSGSFYSGTLTIVKSGANNVLSFNFQAVKAGSTFSAGSITLSVTVGGFDANTGEFAGAVQGQIALTQPGLSTGTLGARCAYMYYPGYSPL